MVAGFQPAPGIDGGIAEGGGQVIIADVQDLHIAYGNSGFLQGNYQQRISGSAFLNSNGLALQIGNAVDAVVGTGNNFLSQSNVVQGDDVDLSGEGQPCGAASDEADVCLLGDHSGNLRGTGGVHLQIHGQVLFLEVALRNGGSDRGGTADGGMVDHINGCGRRAGIFRGLGLGFLGGFLGSRLGILRLVAAACSETKNQNQSQQNSGELFHLVSSFDFVNTIIFRLSP